MNYDFNDVAITYNEDESRAVLEGLNCINAQSLFTNDDIVVIIPNWVNKDKPHPSSGITVGPNTLRTIIQWVKTNKPRRIIIATGSGGGDTLAVMQAVGYDKIIQEEGIEFIDFNKGPYDELVIDHPIIHSLKINKILNEKIKLISFTQLKQHEESTMSASIKNVMLSIPSTEEHGTPKKNLGIHKDLHGFISKMALKIRIDLSIISCNPAMVGTGPSKGIPFHTGLVICGNNPVSSDTIAARFLGFKPQGIHYLYQLEKENMKESNVNKINIKGLSLRDAELIFSQKVYHNNIAIDK